MHLLKARCEKELRWDSLIPTFDDEANVAKLKNFLRGLDSKKDLMPEWGFTPGELWLTVPPDETKSHMANGVHPNIQGMLSRYCSGLPNISGRSAISKEEPRDILKTPLMLMNLTVFKLTGTLYMARIFCPVQVEKAV